MATKKQQPEKQYILFDPENDVIGVGSMEEIRHQLLEFESDSDDYDEVPFDEWITQCRVCEMSEPREIKYTLSKFEFK